MCFGLCPDKIKLFLIMRHCDSLISILLSLTVVDKDSSVKEKSS